MQNQNHSDIKYVKLLDKHNLNEVLKIEEHNQYRFIFGIDQWKRTGILLQYQNPESEYYEKYQEITEESALELINNKKNQLQKTYEYLIEKLKDYKDFQEAAKKVKGVVKDLEYAIVALLFYLGQDVYEEIKEKCLLTPNVVYSLKLAFGLDNYNDEEQMLKIRSNGMACRIIKWEIRAKELEYTIHNEDAMRYIEFLDGKREKL